MKKKKQEFMDELFELKEKRSKLTGYERGIIHGQMIGMWMAYSILCDPLTNELSEIQEIVLDNQ